MSERSGNVNFVKEISQDEKKPKVSAAARVFNVLSTIFVYLLSAGILIGAVLFAMNASPTKSIFGYRYYTVLTPSMSPSYEVGDVVIVHIEKSDTIGAGDVITFNPSNDSEAYLTHRVTEKFEDYKGTGVTCFRTKGDANDSEDSFLIDEEKVVGKVVFGIPKLGYIIRFVQLRWYFVAAIIVMIVVFIYLLKIYFRSDEDEDHEDADDGEAPGGDAVKKEDAPDGEASGGVADKEDAASGNAADGGADETDSQQK